MIQVSHLSKKFKSFSALEDISLTVESGKIFGLLGPNGAGKTTLIRVLAGIIKSDGGRAAINNKEIQESKQDFGYVAQHFGQYEELSVWENIKFYAQMYNVPDELHLNNLMNRYGLSPYKNKFAGSLSGGYQRRLALVCAIAHNPKVLFLDEPTAGIDPVTRKLLWDDFYRLSSEGTTLFVTTHYMEEASRCHELAFLSEGKIVATGTPLSIKKALGESVIYSAHISYIPELNATLEALDETLLVNQFGQELRIALRRKEDKNILEKTIHVMTGKEYTLELSEPNLEDVFIALTQREGALL